MGITTSDKNKMQAAGQSGVCMHCKGEKVLITSKGQKVTCYYCRGTGVAHGNYATK